MSAAQAAARPSRGHRRPTAAAMGLLLLLGACETPGAMDASLTPQQQELREQSTRWNRTMLTGVAAGAALGAGAGYAFGGQNRGLWTAIGGLSGAAAGGLAGSWVANRNLDFERQELSAEQRATAATQIANNLNTSASSAEAVTAENRRRLASLQQQLQAGRITSAQYRTETESMRQDLQVIRNSANDARDARARLAAVSAQQPGLATQGRSIGVAEDRLTKSANALEAALQAASAI